MVPNPAPDTVDNVPLFIACTPDRVRVGDCTKNVEAGVLGSMIYPPETAELAFPASSRLVTPAS